MIKNCNDDDFFCHYVHYSAGLLYLFILISIDVITATCGHVHKDIDNYYFHFNSEACIAVVFNLHGTATFSLWRRLKRIKIDQESLGSSVEEGTTSEFLTSKLGLPKKLALDVSDILVFRASHYHLVEATSSTRSIFQFNAGYSMNEKKTRKQGGESAAGCGDSGDCNIAGQEGGGNGLSVNSAAVSNATAVPPAPSLVAPM